MATISASLDRATSLFGFSAQPKAYRTLQATWLILFALLTRVSVFGDSGYTNDELFYFFVGQRAHEGYLPYVDIWDRKGPGLFLTYYLIAGISYAVVTYQIAAMIAAAVTALIICLIAEQFSSRLRQSSSSV